MPDLCYLPAVEQARLLRDGKVSAVELLEAHLTQIERFNPAVNAIVTLVPELARERAAAADRALAAGRGHRDSPRPADRPQGPRADGGHSNDARLADLRGLGARGVVAVRRTRSGGRRGHARQDEHARVRRRLADLQRGVRRHPEPLRPDEDLRRLERRRRRGARVRHGPARGRERHGRLAAQPGLVLQRRRLSAVSRAGADLAVAGSLVAAQRRGPSRPHRRRRGVAARRHGRARRPLSAVAAGAGR